MKGFLALVGLILFYGCLFSIGGGAEFIILGLIFLVILFAFRIPINGAAIFTIFWLANFLCAGLLFFYAFAGMKEFEGIFRAVFATPLGVVILILILALVFSQARTFRIDLLRFFWIIVFSALLSNFSLYLYSYQDNELLSKFVLGLSVSALSLVPLALLTRHEYWPIVIMTTLFGSFFIVMPDYFARYPSAREILYFMGEILYGLVPALMANMLLMNLVKNRHESGSAVKAIKNSYLRNFMKFLVTLLVLATTLAFSYGLYELAIRENISLLRTILANNGQFIIFTLIVICLNYLSLRTRKDDVPVWIAMLLMLLAVAAFIFYSESIPNDSTIMVAGNRPLNEIVKGFWLACGIEVLGGLVAFLLDLSSEKTFIQKLLQLRNRILRKAETGSERKISDTTISLWRFLIFSSLILLMTFIAQSLALDNPVYWGLLAGFIGGFIDFLVLKQMKADKASEKEEAAKLKAA